MNENRVTLKSNTHMTTSSLFQVNTVKKATPAHPCHWVWLKLWMEPCPPSPPGTNTSRDSTPLAWHCRAAQWHTFDHRWTTPTSSKKAASHSFPASDWVRIRKGNCKVEFFKSVYEGLGGSPEWTIHKADHNQHSKMNSVWTTSQVSDRLWGSTQMWQTRRPLQRF